MDLTEAWTAVLRQNHDLPAPAEVRALRKAERAKARRLLSLTAPPRELNPHLVDWRERNSWPLDQRIPPRAQRRAMARGR